MKNCGFWCSSLKKKTTSDFVRIIIFLIFPQNFCLVSNSLVGKVMEKKAEIHKVI